MKQCKRFRKAIAWTAVLIWMGAWGVTAASNKPNVVIIYGDDVGYGDVGVYGSKLIPTPNIDRLAAEGLRFTDAHSSAATCTPSRYSMLTGIHGFRHDINILSPKAPLCIPTNTFTLPKLFKQAGYTTGVIGKWHLGLGEEGRQTDWNGDLKPGPLELGFDRSFLLPSTSDRVPCVYVDGRRVVNLDPHDPLYIGNLKEVRAKSGSTQYPDAKTDPKAMTFYKSTKAHDNSVINGIARMGYMAGGKSALWDDATMTDEFLKQTKSFITDNKDKPFFLYIASQCIHVPRVPNQRFRGKTALTYRGDSMVEFDWMTGEIMRSLEEAGLTKNTIVIFSSDNGPVYDDGYDDGTEVNKSSGEVDRGHDGSGIWRGGKYQIYEGGTRLPLIIRWPAQIQPGTSDALVSQIDFLASFAQLLGVELPKNAARDSRNTLNAFLGKDPKGNDYIIEEAKGLALREGDWKYIQGNEGRAASGKLYYLKDDPSEQKNIVADQPERASEMDVKLNELIKSGGIRR